MATLDPIHQGGTVATPVINDNSTLTAIKGLTGVASAFLATRGGGDGGKPFDPELATSLQKARSLDRQGKSEEATRIRSRALNKSMLTGAFDPGDSSHTKAFEAFAGVEFEGATLSQREQQIDALESDENFQPSLMVAMSQNPDADQDTLRGIALARTAKMQADKSIIAEVKLNASLNWTTQVGAAHLAVLEDNQDVLNASLEQIAKTGRPLSESDIVQLGAESRAVLSQFTKPLHVTDEQWSPVKQKLDAQFQAIEFIENFSGDASGRMQADRMLKISLAVQEAARGGTTAEQMAASAIVASGSRAFETMLGMGVFEPSDVARLLGKVSFEPTETLERGSREDPSASPETEFWTPQTIEEMKGKGKDSFKDYTTQSGLLLRVLDPNVFLNDPEKRGAAAKTISAATRALYNVAAGGDTLAAGEYQSDLFKSLEKSIESFKDVAPEMYDTLRGQMKTVIDAHSQVLGKQLESEFKGRPMRYNPSTGEFRVTQDALVESSLSTQMKASVVSAVDRFYGGDLQAAIEDRGRKVTSFVSDPLQRADEDQTKFVRVGQFLRDASGSLLGLSGDTANRIQSFKHLQKLKGQFTTDQEVAESIPLSTQERALGVSVWKNPVTTSPGPRSETRGIVIHHTGGGGDAATVRKVFDEREVSAHYVIERDGRIVKMMDEGAIAWHAGKNNDSVYNNQTAIGVEIIANNDEDTTPEQVEAASNLSKSLAETYGFDLSKDVVGHGEVATHKQRTEGQSVVEFIRGAT